MQDNVEDVEAELKEEEQKYQSMSKEVEKINKKYQQLKDRHERELREKRDLALKDAERKLKEQQQLTLKWQQMAIQGTPMGATPQPPMMPHQLQQLQQLQQMQQMAPGPAYAPSNYAGAQMNNSPPHGGHASGTGSPRLEAMAASGSVYSDENENSMKINTNGDTGNEAEYQHDPIAQAMGSPHSPQFSLYF